MDINDQWRKSIAQSVLAACPTVSELKKFSREFAKVTSYRETLETINQVIVNVESENLTMKQGAAAIAKTALSSSSASQLEDFDRALERHRATHTLDQKTKELLDGMEVKAIQSYIRERQQKERKIHV